MENQKIATVEERDGLHKAQLANQIFHRQTFKTLQGPEILRTTGQDDFPSLVQQRRRPLPVMSERPSAQRVIPEDIARTPGTRAMRG